MKLIRLPETLAKTGLSRTRLYEAVARGTFPKPVKLGPNARAVAWPIEEVEGWIAKCIAQREQAAA